MLLGDHCHFLAFLFPFRRLELEFEAWHSLASGLVDDVSVLVEVGKNTMVERVGLVGLAVGRVLEKVDHVTVSVQHEIRSLCTDIIQLV